MPTPPGECWTCGHPTWRPEGHAEWCEDVKAILRRTAPKVVEVKVVAPEPEPEPEPTLAA